MSSWSRPSRSCSHGPHPARCAAFGISSSSTAVGLLDQFGVDVQDVAGVIAAGVAGIDVEQSFETCEAAGAAHSRPPFGTGYPFASRNCRNYVARRLVDGASRRAQLVDERVQRHALDDDGEEQRALPRGELLVDGTADEPDELTSPRPQRSRSKPTNSVARTAPIRVGDPVDTRTNHGSAIAVISVPVGRDDLREEQARQGTGMDIGPTADGDRHHAWLVAPAVAADGSTASREGGRRSRESAAAGKSSTDSSPAATSAA